MRGRILDSRHNCRGFESIQAVTGGIFDLVLLLALVGNLAKNVVEAHVGVEATYRTSRRLNRGDACGQWERFQSWVD